MCANTCQAVSLRLLHDVLQSVLVALLVGKENTPRVASVLSRRGELCGSGRRPCFLSFATQAGKEAALLLSTVLTYAVLGVVGVGRPKRLPPVDPTKHHTLNFTSAGLRLGPPKRAKLGGVVGDENACPGAAATNQCAESEDAEKHLKGQHTQMWTTAVLKRTADGAEPPARLF